MTIITRFASNWFFSHIIFPRQGLNLPNSITASRFLAAYSGRLFSQSPFSALVLFVPNLSFIPFYVFLLSLSLRFFDRSFFGLRFFFYCFLFALFPCSDNFYKKELELRCRSTRDLGENGNNLCQIFRDVI